jgi:hypothetical protein
MSTYDPNSYLELWVPEQDMQNAAGEVVGVKRTLRARVSLDGAVVRMSHHWYGENSNDAAGAMANLLRAALGEDT